MTSTLSAYLSQDRRRAQALGQTLPDRTHGAALFADISGFTPLTEALAQALGPRRGVEALTRQLDLVYDTLIAEVEQYGGSAISFAGDALLAWFDEREGNASARAVTCALGLQRAMSQLAVVALPNRAPVALTLKAAVASGPARRFVVGDPNIRWIDALAGVTVARTALAEHLARPGEVLVDSPTAEALGEKLQIVEWRADPETSERFAVVASASGPQSPGIRPQSTDLSSPIPPEQLRPWLLPAVYDRERSGQGAFLTELRPAVALFLRFAGIDYESDEAGAQLDAFIGQAQGVLARYEGVLLELTIGDKGSYLYAAFGAPVAHEDDPRRALKAALDLKTAAARLDFLEPVHIGLSRGTMRVGAYGGAGRRTYGVLGDDVNLAARLMVQAAPGEILVSGRVHQAVAADFAFEPHPPIPLKGKAEPLPVFAVLGAQIRRAIRLQEPSYALPMVGRQTELQTISAKMDLALQGQGQVIGIVAEAGLGKSRLVAEVIRAARRKGLVGYGGACQSDGVNTPYLVWRPIWSAFFDVDPELPLRKQVRLLETEIADPAPQRVQTLPLLGVVLGLPLPDNDFTQALDPKTRKSALHALLEDCLKAAAREEPLLLVFEDLHWLDALSHDLLEELARATTTVPICFVLAYRPSQYPRLQAPRLETLPHFTRITLTELSPAECEQAIRAKLAQLYPARSRGVPPGLATKLTARAQGNPFYLEELLNYLRDRGLDPLDPLAMDKIDLPDSLHALILSRIDQLSDREKTTLRVASIIGRLFHAAWLPGYYPELGELARVKADLDELDRLDITPLAMPEPELAYLFKHIVTHEVTYESLPYATRAQLHEQLARYLEAIYPGAPPLDTLAYHYGQSTNTAKQRDYFRKAGEAAKAAFANDAALEYYARLLPLLPEPADQVDLHLQWGAVLQLMGRWNEVETHYRDALTLATQDAARAARCHLALGKLCRLHGDYLPALNWLEQARQGWEALQDRAGLGQALIETGVVFSNTGEYAVARQHLQEGLAQARSVGDRESVALALNVLGAVVSDQGDYATARALFEESLALRREMGDKRGISASLTNIGIVLATQGDYATARALYQESLALDRQMGDKWGISISLNNLGNLTLRQGDYTAAWTHHAESLALRREMGDKRGIGASLNNLGLVALSQGHYAAARASYEDSLKLRWEMSDKRGIGNNLVGLASVACYERASASSARLAAAAETLLAAIQFTLEPLERRVYDETLASTRAALGEEAFHAAWAEGQALTLEEAIALALSPTPDVAPD